MSRSSTQNKLLLHICCAPCSTHVIKKLQADFSVTGYFATTLTISPHKRADVVNEIGAAVGQQHRVKFYAADFKKEGGFQESVELAKEHGLYRQNYCGCEFSRGK